MRTIAALALAFALPGCHAAVSVARCDSRVEAPPPPEPPEAPDAAVEAPEAHERAPQGR